jgi:sporulation protein YlmC with PRC-barrel domain
VSAPRFRRLGASIGTNISLRRLSNRRADRRCNAPKIMSTHPARLRSHVDNHKGDDPMKSKLLSAIALPAALAVGAATAFAQTTEPSPSPAPAAPEERMPETTPPSPSPSPSVTDTAPSAAPGTFAASQAADEWRSSKLVGQSVYNNANEKVGDINDLILGADGKISHAVIGVGGFLGLGEKLVGVAFGDLNLNREADGSLRVTIDSTKEALQNAPDFKYHDDKAVAQ